MTPSWSFHGSCNCASLDRGQLRDVAADVHAIGVEAACLPERVQCAAGGTRSCPGDPLPVADVVGDVAIDRASRRSVALPCASRRAGRGRGTMPLSAVRGCACTPRVAAVACRHRRLDSRSCQSSTPRARRGRRSTGRGEDAYLCVPSRVWRRAVGGRSRAMRVGARTALLRRRLRPDVQPRAARGCRSAGTATGARSRPLRGGRGRRHSGRHRSAARRRASAGPRLRRPAEARARGCPRQDTRPRASLPRETPVGIDSRRGAGSTGRRGAFDQTR